MEDFKIEGEFEIEEELEGIEEGDIEEVEVDVCVTKDDRDEKMIEEVGSEINPFLTIGRCSEGNLEPKGFWKSYLIFVLVKFWDAFEFIRCSGMLRGRICRLRLPYI